MSTKIFHFSVNCNVSIAVDDIWPDGDAPASPTVDDVLAVIAKCGGARRVIRDWSLDDDLVIVVSDDTTSKEAP